jgi:hypothetical protein
MVLAERVTAPLVELNHGSGFEASSGEPYSKATSPCEKLEGSPQHVDTLPACSAFLHHVPKSFKN